MWPGGLLSNSHSCHWSQLMDPDLVRAQSPNCSHDQSELGLVDLSQGYSHRHMMKVWPTSQGEKSTGRLWGQILNTYFKDTAENHPPSTSRHCLIHMGFLELWEYEGSWPNITYQEYGRNPLLDSKIKQYYGPTLPPI